MISLISSCVAWAYLVDLSSIFTCSKISFVSRGNWMNYIIILIESKNDPLSIGVLNHGFLQNKRTQWNNNITMHALNYYFLKRLHIPSTSQTCWNFDNKFVQTCFHSFMFKLQKNWKLLACRNTSHNQDPICPNWNVERYLLHLLQGFLLTTCVKIRRIF
jgi:hypothetical protein